LLVLDPARLDANIAEARKRSNVVKAGSAIFGGLDESLDLNVLRELQSKTTVVPVISKADTITGAHMRYLKKTVWDTIKRAKLDPLEALNLDLDEQDPDVIDERDEDDYAGSSDNSKTDVLEKILGRSSSEAARSITSAHSSSSHSPPSSPPNVKRNHSRKPSAMSVSIHSEDSESPFLPLSIISPDPYEPDVIGRKFPWGFADPHNPEHCDFERLRDSIFSEWRAELREASREQWYEAWRTNRLEKGSNTRRHNATSDGPSVNNFSVPASVGRASSAGSTYRPYRSDRF
jgi:hypothetical protein